MVNKQRGFGHHRKQQALEGQRGDPDVNLQGDQNQSNADQFKSSTNINRG
jgi:hypothetical protein